MSKPSFNLSSNVRFVCQEFLAMKIGDTLSYADLSRRIGFSINGGSPALQSAKRVVLRDNNVVIAVERGVGVRRLADAEIIRAVQDDISVIRRRARRSARKMIAVDDFGALSSKDQLAYTVNMAVLSLTAEVTSRSGQSRLEKAAVGASAAELPLKEIVEAFR